MTSRYEIFCRVVELKSFTKAAEQTGYSQSAVSQTVKALEQEMGATLIDRKRDGLVLTPDGEQFLPFFQSIYSAEESLAQKQREMQGLENSVIRIGTFTSVSRNILPPLMKRFKERYPEVHFMLKQGDYTEIGKWIRDGSVDFGFVNPPAVPGLPMKVLYQDEMMAVLPQGHPLAARASVPLRLLAQEPFILMDEGEYSVTLHAFKREGLTPRLEYQVYDDYTILSMVRQGLGVSALYRLVVQGFEAGLDIRPVEEKMPRTMALAWQNWETMPLAARKFAEFVIKKTASPLPG